MTNTPKVLVLITDGINCNIETKRAFEIAGAKVSEIHLNEILSGKYSFTDFDIVAFPGGFSYGDDIKSGKILSLNLLKLKEQIQTFLSEKKLIIGICNGFQVLTTLGVIPFQDLGNSSVSLAWNDSAKFECRWVEVKIPGSASNSPWLKNLGGKTLKIQAAHAEGKLFAENEEKYEELFEKNLVAFQYVDKKGNPTEVYPFNPNGSKKGVAALLDTSGQVLGMMPHPERNVEDFQHPNFRNLPANHVPDGLQIFINAVEYIKTLG